MRIAVIGAGIIGVTTAFELGRDGHEVTVFERCGTVAAETSFANAGVIAPGYVTPWAAPGMPLKALKWMLRPHSGQKLFAFALACILGGAVGNVVDRILHGYVVDFLDFHWGTMHFPAFNVADSGITIGAACLILDEILRVRRGR